MSWFVRLGVLIAVVGSVVIAAQSHAAGVGGQYSGSFFNLDHNGAGLAIEVIDGAAVNGYWYTYDRNGYQMWLLMQGELDGDTVAGKLFYTEGMKFETLDPDDLRVLEFGSFVIQFSGCNDLNFEFDPVLRDYDGAVFPAGSIRMTRLTTPLGIREQCGPGNSTPEPSQASGGIFEGNVVSSVANQSVVASGVVTENDRLWFVTESGLYFGTLYRSGNSFRSRLSAVVFSGYVLPDGGTFGFMDVEGTFVDGQLKGAYETFSPRTRSVIDRGSFELADNGLYENSLSQAQLAGTWKTVQGSGFSINSQGRLTGRDDQGCNYDGTVVPVDGRFNAAHGTITISRCSHFDGFADVIAVRQEDGSLLAAFAGGAFAGLTLLKR